MRKKYVLNRLGLIACVAMLIVASVPIVHAAFSVSTDKGIYSRGQTVTVTVSGGTANGIVAIQFKNPSGSKVWTDQGTFSGAGGFTYYLKIPSDWVKGYYTIDVKDSDTDKTASASFGVGVTPPTPPPPPSVPPTVEDIEALSPEEAAVQIESLSTEDAADLIEEANASTSAAILEEVSVEVAAEIIQEVSVETASEIIDLMNSSSSAEVLITVEASNAASIMENVEEEDAGDILDAAVEANNTDSFADVLNEMDEDKAAGAMLQSQASSGAKLVESMADKDLTKAAERVEAAVKLKARELTPEAQQALLQRAADMLEDVTTEKLVDLFIEITGLPATPSTVAEVFEVMEVPKVLDVVSAWISTGALDELAEVFEYLTVETLEEIWTGMSITDRVALRPHLSAETVASLPEFVVIEKPEVVVHLKGALEPDLQLSTAMAEVSQVEWTVVYEEIAASDLSDATMLIMVQADSSLDYTEAELSAITSWLDEGGKTVWVAADSDYGTDSLRQATANEALESFGSVLRIEQASVEDPVSNGGAPYRVLAVSDYVDPEVAFLVSGVDRGLFHGPGIIVGYVDGEYVKLEEESPEDVYVVMTTSENGIVVDNSEPSPEIHMAGDEGTFPVMVLEIDYEKGNNIIATGDAPFGQYTGLYKPELRRADRYGVDANPQQGGRLFDNIIDYVAQYARLFIDTENTIEAKETEIKSLESDISSLESDKASFESEVSSLTGQVSSLEGEVSDLEDEVAGFESQVDTLERSIEGLNEKLSSASKSVGSWQMYTVILLILGIVVGFFAGPFVRKP